MPERIAALLRRLSSRRLPAVIIVLATALAASSLGGGRTLDDWVLAVIARGEGAAFGLSRKRWDCFTFATGDAARNLRLMSRGVLLPWWTDQHLKIAFFRPLAAATHVLDEALWPNHPVALHAHSLLWFCALLIASWKVYQRLAGSQTLANLSFALYALDDAHGATLSWIANRNALISATLGCACIVAHDTWRRNGSRAHAWLSLALFALSCLAGELGLATLAYLIAYALFLEQAPARARVQSLVGYTVWCVAWRAGWSLAGYGARGSGAYVDPVADPLAFFADAPRKWLSLLQGQLGVIPADLAFLGPADQQRLWLITGLATLLGAAVVVGPLLPDRRARFWLFGAMLALLPMAASFPSDRLLLFVGLGVMPLLAGAFLRVLCQLSRATGSAQTLTVHNALAFAFFAIHGLLAPALLPFRAAQMGRMARAEQSAFQQLAAAADASKILIALNTPSLLLTSYAQLRSGDGSRPRFASLYVLSATDSPVSVTRTGVRELTLHADLGFLRAPLERHYRGNPAPFARQRRVALIGLMADVIALRADGRPASVRFTLLQDLSAYVFECWANGAFRRCELPALGHTLRLAPADLNRILFGNAAQ
jgi:hypothetical protein